MPSYTDLESLLLFQALRAESGKSEPFSFTRISEQLKGVPLVRNDPSYSEGRLDPDALRDCYLTLVKEEAKKDLEHQYEKANAVTNGDVSPGSRKRKAPSPSIPTVQEAAEFPHLIPRLVERLYQCYRDSTISQIREYERRHDVLSREISDIEAGKWDERLERQRPASASASAANSPRPSTAAHTQPSVAPHAHAHPSGSADASPAAQQKQPDVKVPQKKYSQATIDAVMNHGPEPQYSPGGHRRTSSNTQLPPLSEMAPHSPRYGIPAKVPPIAPQMPPHMQSHHAQRPSVGHSPPQMHQSPYGPPQTHAVQSPQLQNSISRPSSSPRPILPPPPGMQLPPPSPGTYPGPPHAPNPPGPHTAQQHFGQSHRTSIGQHPPPDHRQQPVYPAQAIHQPGYYAPTPPPQGPYQHPRVTYQQAPAPHTPAYASHLPPHQQPYSARKIQPVPANMPPSANAAQASFVPQQQQQISRQQAPVATQPPRPAFPKSPYSAAPATGPRAQPRPQSKLMAGILAGLATPPRRPLWKNPDSPAPLQLPKSPQAEPLSPVQSRAKPASRKSEHDDSNVARGRSSTEPKQTQSRGLRRPARAASRGSTASSAGAELTLARTRSQSTSTTAASVAGGRRGSRADVKLEPSTPADTSDQPELVHEPSASSASGPMTRKRRGTMQSHHQPASKRKRQQSPRVEGDEAEERSPPPPRPNTVLATRNFGKVASAIMNDITSHKHASYFSTGVRDKDASGYSEIIKQPQHLKSIRAAITAGTRAVAAATSSQDSPSTTPVVSTFKAPDGSTTVELERTPDLMPPKAIVNAAQLEKEVYRMLANAVMFNPGEDGLVADTREMFEDVEAKMREWRGADSSAGPPEEDDEGKGKRRKL